MRFNYNKIPLPLLLDLGFEHSDFLSSLNFMQNELLKHHEKFLAIKRRKLKNKGFKIPWIKLTTALNNGGYPTWSGYHRWRKPLLAYIISLMLIE